MNFLKKTFAMAGAATADTSYAHGVEFERSKRQFFELKAVLQKLMRDLRRYHQLWGELLCIKSQIFGYLLFFYNIQSEKRTLIDDVFKHFQKPMETCVEELAQNYEFGLTEELQSLLLMFPETKHRIGALNKQKEIFLSKRAILEQLKRSKKPNYTQLAFIDEQVRKLQDEYLLQQHSLLRDFRKKLDQKSSMMDRFVIKMLQADHSQFMKLHNTCAFLTQQTLEFQSHRVYPEGLPSYYRSPSPSLYSSSSDTEPPSTPPPPTEELDLLSDEIDMILDGKASSVPPPMVLPPRAQSKPKQKNKAVHRKHTRSVDFHPKVVHSIYHSKGIGPNTTSITAATMQQPYQPSKMVAFQTDTYTPPTAVDTSTLPTNELSPPSDESPDTDISGRSTRAFSNPNPPVIGITTTMDDFHLDTPRRKPRPPKPPSSPTPSVTSDISPPVGIEKKSSRPPPPPRKSPAPPLPPGSPSFATSQSVTVNNSRSHAYTVGVDKAGVVTRPQRAETTQPVAMSTTTPQDDCDLVLSDASFSATPDPHIDTFRGYSASAPVSAPASEPASEDDICSDPDPDFPNLLNQLLSEKKEDGPHSQRKTHSKSLSFLATERLKMEEEQKVQRTQSAQQSGDKKSMSKKKRLHKQIKSLGKKIRNKSSSNGIEKDSIRVGKNLKRRSLTRKRAKTSKDDKSRNKSKSKSKKKSKKKRGSKEVSLPKPKYTSIADEKSNMGFQALGSSLPKKCDNNYNGDDLSDWWAAKEESASDERNVGVYLYCRSHHPLGVGYRAIGQFKMLHKLFDPNQTHHPRDSNCTVIPNSIQIHTLFSKVVNVNSISILEDTTQYVKSRKVHPLKKTPT